MGGGPIQPNATATTTSIDIGPSTGSPAPFDPSAGGGEAAAPGQAVPAVVAVQGPTAGPGESPQQAQDQPAAYASGRQPAGPAKAMALAQLLARLRPLPASEQAAAIKVLGPGEKALLREHLKRQRKDRRSGVAGTGQTALAQPAPAPVTVVTAGKPVDKSHTVLAMVIDRSGSMRSMGPELEGGCNAYLDEQRTSDAVDAGRTTVLITTFDDSLEVLQPGTPLEAVQPVTAADVQPRGATALYDAIGSVLEQTAAVVSGLDHVPDVTVFILTDGHENRSRRWAKAGVNDEVTRLRAEHGWDFYFAAANQDAMQTGAAIGVAATQSVTFAPSGSKMREAMATSQSRMYKKKRGQSSGEFSAAERTSCAAPVDVDTQRQLAGQAAQLQAAELRAQLDAALKVVAGYQNPPAPALSSSPGHG